MMREAITNRLSDEDFKLGGDAAKVVREYNCNVSAR